ncbi:translational GTPase TypA [Desulfonatronospira sp.]|uniref:translational GTPase TypA n=1 Tax=Desulfonatronospira sp. TaxID=1962951 RepID=UPI0025C53219|nr:translational GTPase TypA [Desulfonatronospira sp.]
MKENKQNNAIRNIAIIAHVDHGKTTLVDAMFKQSGVFRQGLEMEERIMDSMDLERERGITISAKNCAVMWKGVKINIIDTPGHADFGGEVERSLSMADGAVLLVDASEGPLPQTRFVLKKTLEAGLKIIVAINKIDRKDARPAEVLNEVYDLFIDLDAGEEQLDFPVIYCMALAGIARKDLHDQSDNLDVLFETILEFIPPPSFKPDKPFQMLVSDLGYSDYVGRLAVGRVFNGRARQSDQLVRLGPEGSQDVLRVTKLQTYAGQELVEISEIQAGDIAVISGIEEVHIGDTICTRENPMAMKRITVDEPTVSMKFSINTSPMAGKEGKYVQSSKIWERLQKETLSNVAIQVEKTRDKDSFVVKGRGEFQMAILIETMRREGFELSVGRPQVIIRYQGDKKLEPMEHLFIDCDEAFMGVVTEKLSLRKGRMTNLVNHDTGRIRIEFTVPSRGLIGYRDEFLTDTKGTGIMNSYFTGYQEYRGDFPSRFMGSLVADRPGTAVPYALSNLKARGNLFITPGTQVYEGMVVGEHNREHDLNVNVCKEKKLSNVRAAGKDDAIVLPPVLPMTLERALHFIREDELLEVTPASIRLRKTILSASQRHSARPKD